MDQAMRCDMKAGLYAEDSSDYNVGPAALNNAVLKQSLHLTSL